MLEENNDGRKRTLSKFKRVEIWSKRKNLSRVSPKTVCDEIYAVMDRRSRSKRTAPSYNHLVDHIPISEEKGKSALQ
jgi:hypothetical protein